MIKTLAEDKISYIDAEIRSLLNQKEKIQAQAEQAKDKQGIEKWLDYTFESSSGKTAEYMAFVRDYRREMKKKLGLKLTMLPKTGDCHFGASGFVRNNSTGKLAYWSIDDIRYSPNAWYNNILIRTAEHDKDWTGGINDSSDWKHLKIKLLELTK